MNIWRSTAPKVGSGYAADGAGVAALIGAVPPGAALEAESGSACVLTRPAPADAAAADFPAAGPLEGEGAVGKALDQTPFGPNK